MRTPACSLAFDALRSKSGGPGVDARSRPVALFGRSGGGKKRAPKRTPAGISPAAPGVVASLRSLAPSHEVRKTLFTWQGGAGGGAERDRSNRCAAGNRGDDALRPDQGVLRPLRERAAEGRRPEGGGAPGQGEHALAAPQHASHAIAGGMPIEVAQQNLGHASLATTTVYVKTEEKRRMKSVKKFWEARAGR